MSVVVRRAVDRVGYTLTGKDLCLQALAASGGTAPTRLEISRYRSPAQTVASTRSAAPAPSCPKHNFPMPNSAAYTIAHPRTHTAVVIAVVVRVVLAKTTGALPANMGQRCKTSVIISAVAIAEISLQALMRHQYQRNKYTPP